MNENLSEFAKLIAEGKQAKLKEEENKKKNFFEKYNIEKTEISPFSFLGELAKLKQELDQPQPEVAQEVISVSPPKSSAELLSELSNLINEGKKGNAEVFEAEKENIEIFVEEIVEEIAELKQEEEKTEQSLIDLTVKTITKVAENTNLLSTPEPDKTPGNFKAIEHKLKFLEQWISKISVTGPGSGSYWLNDLGDTDHSSVKNATNNQVLTYDSSIRKWVASSIQPNEMVNNTTGVTSNTYTVIDTDYYIGVNHPAPVTITIPDSLNQGRIIIVKDESGNCYNNPITLSGKIDNDVSGATIKINNGAVQMIFRSGFWRII
jgi:hypothetical protein